MIQLMLFPMINFLYFYISSSRTVCAELTVAVLCSSLISSCFSELLLRYFTNDFEYHFCLYIPQAPYVYFKVITFLDLLRYVLDHIPVSLNCSIY